MSKLEKKFILGALVLAGAGSLMAQGAPPMAADQVSAWSGVVKLIPDLAKALQSSDAIPLLVVACNLIMALLKTEWFQALVMKLTRRSQTQELTDAGKTFMALGVGVAVTWCCSPASTEVRTIGKGLMLGFAAIGMYHAWRHTLKKVFFRDLPKAGDPPPSEEEEVA